VSPTRFFIFHVSGAELRNSMTHEEHGNHLSSYELNDSNLDEYNELVRDGKFVCKHCGRVSVKAENLCGPDPL